ncbi:putative ribonuclease H-like domain-containing protein [Tanacetum coccineum]
MVKPIWNDSQRVNHQNFAKKTHPCAKKNLVPRAALMKSGLVLINTARQVNAAHSKTTVNAARAMSYLSKTTHSTVKRPIHKNTTFKNSNINQKVNIVRGKNLNTTKPKAVVNAVKASAWQSTNGFTGSRMIDSGCTSAHDREQLIDESQVLLRVPRKNNMYSVDLKNIVPKGCLTCLFAKATSDESKLWHRRLGHLNFKTMNKLVKGNLVRGLPSKHLRMNQNRVCYAKGKAAQSLFLMKKMYCLVVIDDYSRFTWVFFLATKDETSGILKSFITSIENLVDHKVKVIRCDNGTEFKNREMNQFCEMKGILRQFSVARTPQQNRVAERRNRTLIEAARTMLANSKLPTTFWAEAVNTACYVQNRVLVVKPHNKTPYELFHGRTPTLSFMRPFGCPVTILNTIDHLGKFDGKADEGFFVGYSLNSKAFRVFNSRTRIVEENLHIRFSESTPNVVGTKASDNAGQARKETEPVKNYILLPLCAANPPFSQDPRSSQDDGSKPSSDDEKKVDEDPRKDSESIDQEKDDNVNSTNNVNAASTNKVNVVGGKTSIELPDDPNMPSLEDISIFDLSRDNEDVGAKADMNNLDTTIQVSPIPTTRIHRDHPLNQVNGDLQSATQTRNMSKNLEEHGFVSTIQQRTNHKDLQNCLFACFLSQEEPKKVIHALKNPRYTQEKGIDYDEVFALVARIEAIRLFLAYASFKDFMVYQMDVKSAFLYGKIEEEVYLLEPGMKPCQHICWTMGLKEGKLTRPYSSEGTKKFGFTKVKTASTPIETQKPLLKDEDGKEVDVHMYRSMIGSLMYLTSSRPDIIFVVCACARYQFNPKVSHLYVVKRIFRDCNEKKLIQMVKIHTDKNVADLLTKAFDLLLLGHLLLLVEVNAVRHKLTTAGDG